MYCFNCGKKVDENAIVCVGCGVALNKKEDSKASHTNSGLASMILGIIGVAIAFFQLGALIDAKNYIDNHAGETLDFTGYSYFARIYPIIFFIIALLLAYASRKNGKTSLNTAGFCLSIITIILWILEMVVLMSI